MKTPDTLGEPSSRKSDVWYLLEDVGTSQMYA